MTARIESRFGSGSAIAVMESKAWAKAAIISTLMTLSSSAVFIVTTRIRSSSRSRSTSTSSWSPYDAIFLEIIIFSPYFSVSWSLISKLFCRYWNHRQCKHKSFKALLFKPFGSVWGPRDNGFLALNLGNQPPNGPTSPLPWPWFSCLYHGGKGSNHWYRKTGKLWLGAWW